MKAIRKYVTGNPDPPKDLTPNEEAILRILGESPGFRGIVEADGDTPIEVSKKKNVAELAMKAARAEPIGELSIISTAINTGDLKNNKIFPMSQII